MLEVGLTTKRPQAPKPKPQPPQAQTPSPLAPVLAPVLVPVPVKPWQEHLKDSSLLIGALVLVGVACGFSGMTKVKSTVVTGMTLATTNDGSHITVVGKVMTMSPASDGRPLLTLETKDGFQATVYVSDDAEAGTLFIGNTYQVEATVQGSLLIANIKGGVKKLATLSSTPVSTSVDAQGYAHVDSADGSYLVPAPGVSPGAYNGTLQDQGGGHRTFTPSED